MRELSERTGWVVIWALTIFGLVSCSPSSLPREKFSETSRPRSGTAAAPSPNANAPKGTPTAVTSPIGRGTKTPNPGVQTGRGSTGVASESKKLASTPNGPQRIDNGSKRLAVDEADAEALTNEGAPNDSLRASQPKAGPAGRSSSRSTRPSEPEISIADLLKVTPSGKEGLKAGDIVPEISGKDMEGQSMRMSDYRGQVVMLDFWGDW